VEQQDYDPAECCKICGVELVWEDCWKGCDDGVWWLYEEDPMWYDEDDAQDCDGCDGKGGYLICPALPHERRQREASQ
jgi:hypothetical protein